MEHVEHRPTKCRQCGSPLDVVRRDATDSLGHSSPTRVDWFFACSLSPQDHTELIWSE